MSDINQAQYVEEDLKDVLHRVLDPDGIYMAPIFNALPGLSPEKIKFLRAFLHWMGADNVMHFPLVKKDLGVDVAYDAYRNVVAKAIRESQDTTTRPYYRNQVVMYVPPFHSVRGKPLVNIARDVTFLAKTFSFVVIPDFVGWHIVGWYVFTDSSIPIYVDASVLRSEVEEEEDNG